MCDVELLPLETSKPELPYWDSSKGEGGGGRREDSADAASLFGSRGRWRLPGLWLGYFIVI
jgi:hypothetical protein